jgi:MoxR-like ATPase
LSQTEHDNVEVFGRHFEAIASNVEKVIQGKREAIELLLLALVSEGHSTGFSSPRTCCLPT